MKQKNVTGSQGWWNT